MPVHYCPHCATKITYEVTKPKTCPKCKKAIVATVLPTLQPLAVEADEDTPRPRVAPVRVSAATKARAAQAVRQRNQRPRQYYDEEGNPVDMAEATTGTDVVDPYEVAQLKAELIASINPSTILVTDEDERPVTFESWCMAKPSA